MSIDLTSSKGRPSESAEEQILLLWCCNDPAWITLKLSVESAVAAGIPYTSMAFAPCDNLIQQRVAEAFPTIKLVLTSSGLHHGTGFGSSFHEFGSNGFARISYQRYHALDHLLRSGFLRVLYVDTDIIFFRNPIPYLLNLSKMFPESILMQDDTMTTSIDWLSLGEVSSWCGGATSWNAHDRSCCTGFMMWNNADSNLAALQMMIERGSELVKNTDQELGPSHQDQEALNELKRIFPANIQMLPMIYFPNGSTLKSTSHGSPNDISFILHANWLVGNYNKEKVMCLYMPLSDLSPKFCIASIARHPEYNVALDKPTAQSSFLDINTSICATDGNVMQEFGFHTRNEQSPWWVVDLLEIVHIKYIILVDRLGFSDRSAGLHVSTSLNLFSWSLIYEKQAENKNVVMVIPVNSSARFVRCALQRIGDLHLCQVIVVPDNAPRLRSIPFTPLSVCPEKKFGDVNG